MKKIIKSLLVICLILVGTCSCFKRDKMEDITVYTTVYPIEYIVKNLYGESSTVLSIYPSGIDINNYELTDKQIKDYAKADLFVYNGLSSEKQIARSFINENKNMKIIDVSYGLNIEYGNNTYEELWLSPNNFLMLATTIKNNLEEFINSTYIKEEIEKKYETIQENASLIDAKLRSIAFSAKNKNQEKIIVSSNSLKFLNNYGFSVISLEDESNITADLKNSFKTGKYKYIFLKDNESNETIDSLIKTYNLKTINVNSMNVLNDEERTNNEDYLTIMNNFLKDISDVTLN